MKPTIEKTTLLIKYPNGSSQVVKPNTTHFKGDWQSLAQAVGGRFFPKDVPVSYEIK